MSARKCLCAFPWYGGKQKHLGWLLPLLPPCHHYCEPFGGAASVLLNREPSPVETYNDLNGDVVNFFRVLREQAEELTRLLALTPYSREEFALACEGRGNGVNDLERARRFYVRALQSFGASQRGSSWGLRRISRNVDLSEGVSQWVGGIKGLGAVHGRLLRVQIEHRPALDILRTYDSPATLFYCDPPYPLQSRTAGEGYRHEMTDDIGHDVEGRLEITSC
jgi:DNA adenine methylase